MIAATGECGKVECGVPSSRLLIGRRAPLELASEIVPLDRVLLAAGQHHGSTFYQHQAFAACVRGGTPPEVYTSLATGIIEGTKNGITDIVGMKFHEHLKYMTLDGHAHMGAMCMMSNDALMALTPEQRRIVDDGFGALRWTAIVLPKRRQIETYEAFIEAGGEIYVPTPDEKAQFVEMAAPIYDWYTETYGTEWLDVLTAAIEDCEVQIAATQADFVD